MNLARFFGMMVARDGVEPPTPAFSAINGPNYPFNQQLNSSRWPIYCDHSVTSADVRLSVGNTHRDCCHNLRRAWILKRKSCHRRESTRADGNLLKLRNTDGYLKRFQ